MFHLLNPDMLKNVEYEDGVTLGLASEAPAARTSKPVLCGHFNGINRTLDFLAENMPEPKREKSSSDSGSGEFYTFGSYEDCFNTFRKEPSKLHRDKELNDKLRTEASSGNLISYGYTGDYIDMGRFMTGEPECFGSMVYGRVEKRVRLVYSYSATYHVNAKVIQRKSLGIGQLIDWLEGNGIRTELIAIESSQVGHMEVMVKRFEDRFVYNDLLVATHPDFLRRIFFRFAEYSPSWEMGYGSSNSCNALLRKYSQGSKKSPFEYVNNEHTLYFSNEDVNEDTEKAVERSLTTARTWLDKVLPDPVDADDTMALFL